MDKYYTPELKDLYVGYECEVKDIPPPEEDWHQWVITTTNVLHHLGKWIKDGSLRTKYLNREDIESLGWKCVWTEGNGTTFQKDDWILDWMPQYDHNIQITKGKAPYFRGKAKSINELKKILEWVL